MQRYCNKRRFLGGFLGAALTFQLGGCDFGQVTTSVTLDGRDLIVSLVRGAVLVPLDTFVTGAIDNLFDGNE